jgi:hypothetical protein
LENEEVYEYDYEDQGEGERKEEAVSEAKVVAEKSCAGEREMINNSLN